MQVDQDIQSLPVNTLAEHCVVETQKFLDRKSGHDTRYCFEMFRRAFVENNQDAYTFISKHYSSLVSRWARERLPFAHSEQVLEECVNWAFASMFRTLSRPGAFDQFPSLERVISYMRSCAFSAAETENRKRRHSNTVELADQLSSGEESPEKALIRAETSEKVRQIVLPLLKDEREQIVYECYFALDMPPRVIFQMNPTLFQNVKEVHRVKQIMLERLSRALRRISEEFLP